jgi:radical SAM superfamily enzyme YgiQ (UPF0313 family)
MSRARVVLVKPPERSRLNFGTYSLGALAAAIRDSSEVSIVDATGMDLAEAAGAVVERRPTLAGITVMGGASVPPAAAFVRRLRAASGGDAFRILCGGHGATVFPTPLLAAGADAIVIGEGETTLREVVAEGIRPGAPGVSCCVNGALVTGPPQALIEPLDRLPTPARDLMPAPPGGVHLTETSRGCPHACAFCDATRFYQRRWRGLSPARTAAEVERLCNDFGAITIQFADDNFAADRRRALAICRILPRGPLPALIMVSARADDLAADPDLLPAMAAARMLRVGVGVETLVPRLASHAGKPTAPETYRHIFQRMRELGMFSVASMIVGMPGETAVERSQAVALLLGAAPDAAQFVPFLPSPGIPMSTGASSFEARPDDERDAQAFTAAFYANPATRARLEVAARRGGITGMLAKGTLERRL